MVSIFSQDIQQQMKNEIVESVMKTLSVLIQENSKRYLRMAEASKYASVSHNTLAKWIEVYKLPVCCIEGVRLVDTHDLDAMIAKYKI